MASAPRVPITNLYMDGEYAATIRVGPGQRPMNVILDTGSSALALDGAKYSPVAGDQTTKLAQTVGYGDQGSWTGAVIQTDISIGSGAAKVTVSGANAAIAYQMTPKVFGRADGVLGLAYAELDAANAMPADTWGAKYPSAEVTQGVKTPMAPYLAQLAGVTSDVFAFYTRRSAIHHGGGAADPLNRGWMIVGGGEACADLYTGAFQTVKVLADAWWNTNLKAFVVGDGAAIPIAAGGVGRVPSNSIVDSGNPSLTFGPTLLGQVLAKFSAAQQVQLKASIAGETVATSDLDLAAWPTLGFILEGEAGDVRLSVAPGDYWQVNAPTVGQAKAALSGGGLDGGVVLGLPLMNGYFTLFDGEADGGRGAIRFATSMR
jgi:Eukaryotic aspartyl protease